MKFLFVPAPFLLALSLAPIAAAQVVDYDHSTLATPPAYGYPLYTPGAGSLGQTVRTQWLCPDSFLSTQLLAPGFVTHIGLSMAGQATYDTFVLRAGTSSISTLTNVWDQNLPDQRVQRDLSNVLLQGGGTAAAPVNQWVEFELDNPFFYQPGQGIVVDLTVRAAVSGPILGTTLGSFVGRAFSSDYQGASTATTVQVSGGLVFRMRIAPLTLVPFGAGCPGSGSFTPALGSTGQSTLGNAGYQLDVTQALPNAFGAFLLGFSRSSFSGGALPYALGGGCHLLASPDAVVGTLPVGGAPGSGAASLPFYIPNWPSLAGVAIYAQFAQLDPASPATAPVVFSNAGTIVIF